MDPHATDTPCPVSEDADRRIVVVGGGYAGVTLAVQLGRRLKKNPQPGVEVVLIELNPCQQALSELDLVAVGPERPEFCELWLPAVLKTLPVRTCFNRVNEIDCTKQVVRIGDGHELPYWRLVVATGAVPSVPPVPGLAENAITMWSVNDAQRLQSRILQQFRLAARLPSAQARREALSFTVCGAGATGVEIIGTIGQLLPKRAVEVGLDSNDLNINLIEGRPEILYDLPAAQRAVARNRLDKLGVHLHTGSMVSEVSATSVTLADGRVIPSSVLVWCGGAAADPDAKKWNFDVDNSNRIVVQENLKTTSNSSVYALGDVASFKDPKTNRTLPMLAQFAIREAEHAAVNLWAEIQGRPLTPFHPHMHGEFVSVGPSWGVGWMWKFKLKGIPAIIMKRFTYVMYWWQVGGIPLAWKRARELMAMGR